MYKAARPYLIGLTGNIATGKSTVAALLREQGARVVDGDEAARTVVKPGTPTLAAIAQTFGPGVLQPNGQLNRAALGQIVFNDTTKLRQLEDVMAPAIRAELQARLAAIPPNTVGVLEAIRLIEGGWDAQCAQVWVTHCQPETQVARLMGTRGLSEAEARARVAAQNPQADKLARADVVIDTGLALEETRAQVVRAWARLPGATLPLD